MEIAGTYEFDEAFAHRIAVALNNAYSDKASSHAYHYVYAHIFGNRTINSFLEVGLFLNDLQHTSLTGWAEVFPSASLYGGDMKQEQLFDTDRIRMSYVDQSNGESLNQMLATFDTTFDVILDDASHMYGSTVCAFEHLFPALNEGGVYLIEDCQGDHPDNNGWQQTVSALSDYLTTNGHTFKVFQAQPPRKSIDPETREESDNDEPSDDYIICVYK